MANILLEPPISRRAPSLFFEEMEESKPPSMTSKDEGGDFPNMRGHCHETPYLVTGFPRV